MSFVRLDSGEFPPLNQVQQSTAHLTIDSKSPKLPGIDEKQQSPCDAKSNHSFSTTGSFEDEFCEDINFKAYLNKTKKQKYKKNNPISRTSEFVKCRVGLKLYEYREDLDNVIKANQIGKSGDFILAPIEPTNPQLIKNTSFDCIPDFVLPGEVWNSQVAVDLSHKTLLSYNLDAAKHYDKIFRHALYLSTRVITLACPQTEYGLVSVASIVNSRLSESVAQAFILFIVPTILKGNQSSSNLRLSPNLVKSSPFATTPSANWIDQASSCRETSFDNDEHEEHNVMDTTEQTEESCEVSGRESGFGQSSDASQESTADNKSSWNQWNNLRSHLEHDSRIGVCLLINNDLISHEEELNKWTGESVRMIIIPTDQFIHSSSHNGYPHLGICLLNFIKRIMSANSFKTSLVLEIKQGEKPRDYLFYLDYVVTRMQEENLDALTQWNDVLQPPLQPLSSNLDSGTYGCFELDSTKYTQYRDAMIIALRCLIIKHPTESSPVPRKFILMVLGAGRGPLVDSFINAIKTLKTSCRFKIYALDKNPSSVQSLKYKQKYDWVDSTGLYETEVVEADMRFWEPEEKADIIATELLGSLSDNELSPECIDGVWKFSTPDTISIPQSYSSYLEPISSAKLHQELHYRNDKPYDQIYVAKLSNYYSINSPQELFRFEHRDLSIPPNKRCNQRYSRLTFWSKTDTICHGFAGYFFANLYAEVTLSTLVDNRTPNMNSWFPAFLPLETPVQMPKDTRLDLHIWRKESATSVWYEWAVTNPIRSRIYSLNGARTAMSKST